MKVVPFNKNKFNRFFARVCLLSLGYQLVFPLASMALTSGPSQPEMQSFEPVGTTDMVNMFSGDFNYNIPLMDVEGYPVNIAYHAGINVEQEASWVGLGWNLNPGNINHIVRGFSDDYNGEKIERRLNIEDEKNSNFQLFTGVEFTGLNLDKLGDAAKKALSTLKNVNPSTQINYGININNYSGLSAFVGQKNGVYFPWISTGINLGTTISTDKGVDIDYSLNLQSRAAKATAGIGFNGSLNSRDGLQYTSFGANASVRRDFADGRTASVSTSTSHTFVPIGLQNFVPIITNATTMTSSFFQVKIGGEVYGFFPYGGGSYGVNVVNIKSDATKKAYGYYNLENASEDDLLDFAREKDGRINKKTKFLPMGNMTYDIYMVNAHGAGGSFRPHRNDIGTVQDPITGSYTRNNSHVAELGVGNSFEFGYDFKTSYTQASSGAWPGHVRKYSPKSAGRLEESYYLKEAGELTEGNDALTSTIGGKKNLSYAEAVELITKQVEASKKPRVTRANLLYHTTAEDAAKKQLNLMPELMNYNFIGFDGGYPGSPEPIKRYNSDLPATGKRISEYTQVLADGRTYVYGLPVKNISQMDFEAAAVPGTADITSISLTADTMISSTTNPTYTTRTKTPEYAHSYMLTCILSADYVDLTGNGISDDDLGTYTKFNYTKDPNYNWRIPYGANTGQRNHGMKSDCKDDRVAFSAGVREQWRLHSIETRNMVAEFYSTPREDGKGAVNETRIFGAASASSYKLDKIVLYNKDERRLNAGTATPIKTVVFYYDYSLCKGLPNTGVNMGKLTLKSIFIKEGSSDIGYLSPYQFKYSARNPNYNVTEKDCWGNNKPNGSNNLPSNTNLNLTNTQYPYVNQNDPSLNTYSSSWNLEEIKLPSGGRIKVTYEADDYAYVQDKPAMEMFKVAGVGPGRKFEPNNTLYNDPKDPYLYVYFKRRITSEVGTISKAYLNDESIMQFTFDVNITPYNSLAGCSSTPTTESVKGYAKVVESGICDNNSNYGYIKMEAKSPNNLISLEKLDIPGAKINPVSLAAINLARYHNPKLLSPETDIPSTLNGSEKKLMNAMIASIADNINLFQNPLKTYLKKGKAKSFDITRSYVRLVSPGLKKKGGGHRVKKLEFFDTWGPTATPREASFGSEYDYTTIDESTGAVISSGVASYEPLHGGDENPCRTLLDINEFGNNSKFPPVDPIEVSQEGPLGESMYPGASVGYSRVTVRSIHRSSGDASQSIQQHEFYTAKEFPITVANTGLETLEDKPMRVWEIMHKREVYRVAQGYAIVMNDMHGKPKRNSTWVRKYHPDNIASDPSPRELVSYTAYNYFRNDDNTLKNNNIPCYDFIEGKNEPVLTYKTLGEDVDIALDSREKREETSLFSFNFSTNCFLAPPLPIAIPIGFPVPRKQSKTFSSFVNTKVIQKYGILQSVETYNRGATIKAENSAFDANTGQAIVTTVNTEYGDHEKTIKFPAYWAYKNMGHAYENIHFEEDISGSKIRGKKAYLNVADHEKYNVGDELEFQASDVCVGSDAKTYKLWVVNKSGIPPDNWNSCVSYTCANASNPFVYIPTSGPCITPTELMNKLYSYSNSTDIGLIQLPIEYAEVVTYPSKPKIINIRKGLQPKCGLSVPEPFFQRDYAKSATTETYKAEIHQTYNGTIVPGKTNYTCTLKIQVYDRVSYFAEKGFDEPWSFSGDDYFLRHDMTLVYSNPHPTLPSFPSYLWSGMHTSVTNGTKYVFRNDNYTSWSGLPIGEICQTTIEITRGRVQTNYLGQIMGAYRPVSRATGKAVIVAAPHSPDSKDIAGTAWGTTTFPENDNVISGKIKVIRSGKRNQLTENVQELTVKVANGAGHLDYNITYNNAIHASAKTFDHYAMRVGQPFNTYNGFAVGEQGSYRPNSTHRPHLPRTSILTANNFSDRENGMFTARTFWRFVKPNSLDPFSNRLVKDGAYWKRDNYINYSVWGMPIHTMDAVGNYSAVQYDFGQTIPTATITQAKAGTFMYESFEDAKWINKYSGWPINTAANPIKVWMRDNMPNVVTGNATAKVLVNESRHTGNNAMQFLQNASIPIPLLGPSTMEWNAFGITVGTKYVFSYWEKASGSGAPSSGSALSVHFSALPNYLSAKTPSINGWVLYEKEIVIPVGAQYVTLNVPSGTIIDDIRIFPSSANMKSYVYDDNYRRLAAILDENHIATIFEYDNTGKMIRVKKETEKGILTINESREALRELLSNGPYNQAY